MKRLVLLAAVLACLVQFGTAPTIAQSDGPLKYLTSSFVTGDVVVGGTSLFRKGVNGFATQNINISGVPANAEILSAYLYVQTTARESAGEDAAIAGAKFKGFSLNTPGVNGGPVAKALNWADGTQACWSYGWNPRRRLITYRADVLRFLEINPSTGKHIANGNHVVQVADAGRLGLGDDDEDSPSMTGPRAVGASLVLIYRSADPAAALRSIVIYDGGATKRSFETFSQRIQGFYQAAAVGPDAKMTHIVGDGQLIFSEKVQFDALTFGANPYIGRLGLRWDNPTFALQSALKTYPATSTQNVVKVSPNGLLSDCLSWSAIVVSTKVQDADNDGLLDIWESSTSEIKDPTGQALPRLQQMGASAQHKDVFVEIGYLKTNGTVIYGTGAEAKEKPAHSHFPPLDALKQVALAFKDSPVTNPDNVQGVNVHFDVGNTYQRDPTDPVNPNGVPSYILPAGLALGGRSVSETAACPGPGDTIVECPQIPSPGRYVMPGQYPNYPGTVGWKTGFRFYRDEILGFSRARKDIFRYALFVHALGIPKEENEFLPGTTTPNPAFHIPRTNTGVADWAGGDHLVAMGAFDDSDGLPVGTPFMQASTLMHEWGHNFGRRHGGDLFELNCKPQYFSVMNYMYQLRGLLDVGGVPRLDYNRPDPVLTLTENNLSDALVNGLRYRMGWYAPKETSYLKNLGLPTNPLLGVATKHCDGSPVLPTDPNMVRIDATGLLDPIDWNADTQTGAGAQDINFDGLKTVLTPGSNDWPKLRFNQLGARRSIGGLFLDKLNRPTVGPLSLNAGKGDLGKGDLGKGDLGKGDLGKGDLGKGDLGKGDLGKGDLGAGIISINLGKGDLGKGDLGGGDLDVGSGVPGAPDQFVALEIDFETAAATTGGNPTPPSAVQACLTNGEGQCTGGSGDRPVRLNWLAPNVGEVDEYLVYRFVVPEPFEPPAAILGTDLIDVIGDGVEEPLVTTYLDDDAPAGAHLAYVVVARFTDGRISGISNFAKVTTPEAEGGIGNLFFSGPNVSAIFDGTPKPVTVTTSPEGLAFSVTYYDPRSAVTSPVPPTAYGAYLVTATLNYPYTGTATIIQTIASTLRAGGTGGGPVNSFCEPEAFATGLRPSTNSYYGLLGYQLLCNAGDNPSRVFGPPNPGYPGTTPYTEADAACSPGDVMVGVHGETAAPFGFTVLRNIGPRCSAPGSDSFYDVGPVGGGTYPGTPFELQCDYPQVARAVVGGVGEAVDGVALVCGPLPAAPPTIASTSPATIGPGQMIVLRGTAMPASGPANIVFNQGGPDQASDYTFYATPTLVIARSPTSLVAGPATVRVTNGETTTPTSAITVTTGPGAPVLAALRSACGGPDITSVGPSQTIYVLADGVDTSGTSFIWTPAEGPTLVTGTNFTTGGPGYVCTQTTAPAGLTPGQGPWTLSITTTVASTQSPQSNAIGITVP